MIADKETQTEQKVCPSVSVLIVAGGSGARFSAEENKLLTVVNGKPVIAHTIGAFERPADETVLVVPAALRNEFEKAVSPSVKIVTGGATRTESVRNGLKAVTGNIVLVHDGARPFVSADLITRCIEDIKKHGSAIAAVKTIDSIAETENGIMKKLLPRAPLYNIQTPQGFLTGELLAAYEKVRGEYPDDSSVYAAGGGNPHITEGEYGNHKITVRADLKYFETEHSSENADYKIGNAFDTHRLVAGRKLILGGIHIPFEKGLLGHSDADALLHAVMGAVLNALGLKDIGTHFPDTDPLYKGADSTTLLAAVLKLMSGAGYRIGNVSFTVIAQQPKLAPHIDAIKQNLSRLLSVPETRIGLAATTAEGMGAIGNAEAIACMGHVLLKRT